MTFLANFKIRTRLMLLFVTTGLFPLVIVGVGSGFLAREALLEKSFGQLETVQAIHKRQIETAVNDRCNDLKVLAVNKDIRELAETLQKFGDEQGVTDEEKFPVNSPEYRKLTSKYADLFAEVGRAYGLDDILLVSANGGQVMFSSAAKSDLGENLEYGSFRNSPLARVWRQVEKEQRISIIDFSPYASSAGKQELLIGQPVKELGGKLLAVLIAKASPDFINSMIRSREGMGNTGESYLIAFDKKSGRFSFRSNLLTMGQGRYVVGYEPDFELKYWKDAIQKGVVGGSGEYADSEGNEVLVTFGTLDLHGLNWILVSKVDVSEVMAPVWVLARNVTLTAVAMILIVSLAAALFSRGFTSPIVKAMVFARAIAKGNLKANLVIKQKDELGELGGALNSMARNLRALDWFKSGKEILDDQMRGEFGVREISRRFIRTLVKQLEAQMGAVYLAGDDESLVLTASYAFSDREGNFNRIWPGEGLVGQAVLEREMIIFSRVQEDVPGINYGAGDEKAAHYLIAPLVFDSEVIGAFLVASTTLFEKRHKKFVESNAENIAVLLNGAKSRKTIQDLLAQSQAQQDKMLVVNEELEKKTSALEEQTHALKASEAELQAQQEELRVSNEELEEQAQALKKSQSALQSQREELQTTNEELEARTLALEEQKKFIQKKNSELVKTRKEIRKKALELEDASKYKSEFLANMSHELRTPLNSILILSQLFAGNREGNLNGKQVDAAKAIHSSGSELLRLINEILDLSKVEAGKIELQVSAMQVDGMMKDLDRMFKEMAAQQGSNLVFECSPTAPKKLVTDSHRLQQVLRNLLSNAIKFTKKGTITVRIAKAEKQFELRCGADRIDSVALSVTDTGIGIPKEKQGSIFEAFKQADGSTSRNFGGTGLGLSISKELVKLLGGRIELRSEEGKGSCFELILPANYHDASESSESEDLEASDNSGISSGDHDVDTVDGQAEGEESNALPESAAEENQKESGYLPDISDAQRKLLDKSDIRDDRRDVSPEEKSLLIIEDDPHFAKVLRDLGRESGFKCLIAGNGETGLHFADFYEPSAIILDIGLPGIDGWTVMSRLKANPKTRHIPVHFMSAADKSLEAMRMGAVGFMTKPVSLEKIEGAMGRIEKILSRPMGRLLVVEDDSIQRQSIRDLIDADDVEIVTVGTGSEAIDQMRSSLFDCMILDLGLEDMSGFELLEKFSQDDQLPKVPVIIYTGRDIDRDEELELQKYAESIIIKGVRSPERLLDESALFLHRVEADLPEDQKNMLKKVHSDEEVLENKKILMVDDDMRNVFALNSVLEEKGIDSVIARNGKEALEKLDENPDIDLVLMDIMMPEMDGYEAMSHIRKDARFKKLPIIALTAKAMVGDKAKCIEAGASDYLAKPVDTDKLISMLRVWLHG